jgi:Domain of unknown function (DUF4189)
MQIKKCIASLPLASILALAVVVLPATNARAGDPGWISVAANGRGYWGYGYNKRNADSAKWAAMNGCNSNGCKTVFTARTKCFAYAESRQGGYWYGTGYGSNGNDAGNIARSGCAGGAPQDTCKLVTLMCPLFR